MCFSANASFTTGTVLMIAGIASVRKVKNRSQLAFAAIPVLFGIQQLCEGFLWLVLKHPSSGSLQELLTLIFLLFALVIWPIYVPYSFFCMEKDPWRKKMLTVLLVLGFVTSLYMAYSLLLYPVSISMDKHHIHYLLNFPMMENGITRYAGSIFYFLPTVIPPFLSANRKIQLIGGFLFGSYLVTKLFFGEYVISVWCFFAAIVSVAVLSVMVDLSKKNVPVIK